DYSLPDAEVRVATPGPDPLNGDHHFLIQILGKYQNQAVQDGVWQLRIRPEAPTASNPPVSVDVWALDSPLDPAKPMPPQVFFTGAAVNDGVKIGAPGIAASAITVAAYTTRTQWTDIEGGSREVSLALNDISDFSSPGPSRTHDPATGRGAKPDFTA